MDDISGDDHFVFKDAYVARNWDLLHGGGAHTLEHHDGGGYPTTVKVESGMKMWGIIRPTGYTGAQTRTELDALNGLFIRKDPGGIPKSWDLPWVKKGGQVFAIPARPGDQMCAPELLPLRS